MIWLAQIITGRTTDPRPDFPRTLSTAFDDPASTRLGQFFGPAADKHPGLSGFSLLSQGREAFITRLALADLAERSLDMQYYVWDGDTTGRIIVEHVMKAADRGVRVRLLVDDPCCRSTRNSDTPSQMRGQTKTRRDDTSVRLVHPSTSINRWIGSCSWLTYLNEGGPFMEFLITSATSLAIRLVTIAPRRPTRSVLPQRSDVRRDLPLILRPLVSFTF